MHFLLFHDTWAIISSHVDRRYDVAATNLFCVKIFGYSLRTDRLGLSPGKARVRTVPRNFQSSKAPRFGGERKSLTNGRWIMPRYPLVIAISSMTILVLMLTGPLPQSVDPVLAGFTPTPEPPQPPEPPPVPPEPESEDPGKKPEKVPAQPPPLQLPTAIPSEPPPPVLPETGEISSLQAFRSLLLLLLGSGMIALAMWGRHR
jgi:hypothetical protein